MLRSVRIIDDFLPAAIFEAQRRTSATASYQKIRFRGLDYSGVRRDESFDSIPLFARHGVHIRLQTQYFRIYEEGMIQPSFIRTIASRSMRPFSV